MEESQEAPLLFRCPISMELMEDPTTVSTGVTYERKNIERWIYSCKKSTCPATMQHLDSFHLTPNHTLKRLIDSWRRDLVRSDDSLSISTPSAPAPAVEHDMLLSLLADVESSPFKATSLKKLQSALETGLEAQNDFVSSDGIQVLTRVMSQVVVCEEGAAAAAVDFSAFRACEESVGVLRHLPVSDALSADLLSKPDCVKHLMLVLQRGSAEARVHTMDILQKLSRANRDWMPSAQEADVCRSLLELLSDEVSAKLSSCSLDVLIEIVAASKKNRHRAIEAGAVCVMIELLPDATNKRKCERILLLLKTLCECPEGRAAFVDHGLGVAAVSKKVLRVSESATKLGVKILSLVCNFVPTEKVIDEMVAYGAVRKLFCLLHVDGRSSTKDKAVKMIRVHGGVWKQYPCFPCDLKEYLKLVHRS